MTLVLVEVARNINSVTEKIFKIISCRAPSVARHFFKIQQAFTEVNAFFIFLKKKLPPFNDFKSRISGNKKFGLFILFRTSIYTFHSVACVCHLDQYPFLV